jgi:hypothetical protein
VTRRLLAISALLVGTAAAALPVAPAAAICELPTGQTCPNPCPSVARYYDGLQDKYPLPERPFECWT